MSKVPQKHWIMFGVIALLLGGWGMTVNTSHAYQDDPKAKAAQKDDDEASKDGGEKEEEQGVDMKKVSYAIGVNIGRNVAENEISIDLEEFTAGLKAAIEGADLKLTDEQMAEVMTAFQLEQQQKMIVLRQKKIEEAKKRGTDFLAKNAEKEGVKTTKSGLQYKVIESGKGKTPKATDKVTVHYRGRLIDDKEFDSSYNEDGTPGDPAQFPVNRVIPGWTEVLQLMREGDQWEVYLPSELAYGERGAGNDIGPNEVLIFHIHLLKVAGSDDDSPKEEAPEEDSK